MTIFELIEHVKSGKISCVDRLEAYLKEADQKKDLNAFTVLLEVSARAKAKEVDTRIKKGEEVGPLAGVVVAIKDNIHIKGQQVSCGSNILKSYNALYNATVVEKLNAADAIIIGKTNMDEFAMGSSNENSAFGPVKNPHNKAHVSGGSSGGSAVAVAAGLADIALGSDTGGSVRQPAAFTGTVGLKPSYGRVSRYGLTAYASSLDQIGVFARSSKEAAYILQHIAGHDVNDSTSANREVGSYIINTSNRLDGLKVGLPRQYFGHGLDPEIEKSIKQAAHRLSEAGAEIVDIDLPYSSYAIATYYIIATAEASANLARYDGVRYGHRTDIATDLNAMYSATRSEGFGEEVRLRILLGTYVLSSGYYDAYYKKAQKVRRIIKQDFDSAFLKCDVLLSPTTPAPAFKIGEKTADPMQMYLSDIYTVSANLAGICAISVPYTKHSTGLPIGLQLQAPAFNEEKLFQIGHTIENI